MSRASAARRSVYAGPGFAARLRSHRRSMADAWWRVWATPLASVATLAVLGLALLLPLLLGLFISNALRVAEGLGTVQDISVFLNADIDAAGAEALRGEWASRPDVAAVLVRTPDEGLAEFRQTSDLAASLELLEGNPLPFVLLVSPAGDAAAAPAALVETLEAQAGVESVQFDAAWRARLDAWLALGRHTAMLLGVLLLAGAVLVVGNTVRLDLASRRDEVALMQLLGADDADIRRPMLHFGSLLGLLAGGLALAGAWATGAWLSAPLQALIATYAEGFRPIGASPTLAFGVLIGASIIGWLGARVAAGHYLRTSRPAES